MPRPTDHILQTKGNMFVCIIIFFLILYVFRLSVPLRGQQSSRQDR